MRTPAGILRRPMSRLSSSVVLLADGLATRADALEVGARLDAQAAFALSQPQASLLGPGAVVRATGLLEPVAFLDVALQAGLTALTARADSGLGRGGSAFELGPGVRLKRPMQGSLVVPFVEVVALFAASGGPNIDVAPTVGVLFRTGADSALWFGLSAGAHVMVNLAASPGLDPYTAAIMGVWLSLEYHYG